MPDALRIKRNSFFSFISITSRLVTNVILFLIIARFYGPESFGSFSAAHTISMMFLLLADFGFDMLIMTEIAKAKSKAAEIFQKFIPIKIVFTSAALILLWITGLFIPSSEETKSLIFVLSINMVLTTLSNMFFASFKGIEEFQHEALISSMINIVLLIGVIVLSYLNVQIIFIALAIVISRSLGIILAFYKFNSVFSHPKLNLEFKNWNKELKVVFIFGLHLLFGTLYFQLDTVMLLIFKGDYEVGIYQSVFKLMVLVLTLPEILVSVVLPAVTGLYAKANPKWEEVGGLLFKILFLTSLPIALIFFSYPEFIIKIVYSKPEFLVAVPILKLASFVILIRYCAEPFAMLLTATGKQAKRTAIVIAATIVNLTLNLFVIKLYGSYGAILVSIFTNLFTAALYIYFVREEFIKWIMDAKYLINIFIVTAIWYLINQISFTPWLTLPLCFIGIVGFSYAFNFSPQERLTLFRFKKEVLNDA